MILIADQTPGPLIVDIINSLLNNGHQVTLFSGSPARIRGKLDRRIKTVNGLGYYRDSNVARILTWSLFSIQYFFYLLFCRKPSVIMAVTNPPFLTFITGFIAKFRRIPFCLLIYDLYPEALTHAEIGTPDSAVFKLWKKCNVLFFNRANKIFAISNTMKKEISKYCSLDKIQVIHNWADTDYIKPLSKSGNRLVSKLGLTGKKVVLYAGNCGLTHDLESLVQAANILRDSTDIVFVISGEGAKKEKLGRIAHSLGLDNIIFLPYQNDNDFPLLMAAADIGIVTLGVGSEAISVPSKTYTNLAAGVCLIAIAHATSELGEIISNYEVGHLCAPQDPAGLAATIKYVLDRDDVLNKYKANARTAVAHFTKKNADLYSRSLQEFC